MSVLDRLRATWAVWQFRRNRRAVQRSLQRTFTDEEIAQIVRQLRARSAVLLDRRFPQ